MRPFIREQLAPRHTLVRLAAGDLLALLAFAVASAARHGGGSAEVVETALQYGAGWVVAAAAVGAYGSAAVGGWRRGVRYGAATWSIAAVLGGVVRYLTEPGAGLGAVFLLVTVGVGAALFGGWRALAGAWLAGRP